LAAASIPFLMMQFHHFDPDQDVSAFNLPRETAWWWAILGGIVLALIGPLLLMVLFGLGALIVSLPSLSLLGAVELIRRALLVVLNKSTSPRTSPFAYLSGLASVILAAGEAVHKLMALWL
jgi:hypothetical protein